MTHTHTPQTPRYAPPSFQRTRTPRPSFVSPSRRSRRVPLSLVDLSNNKKSPLKKYVSLTLVRTGADAVFFADTCSSYNTRRRTTAFTSPSHSRCVYGCKFQDGSSRCVRRSLRRPLHHVSHLYGCRLHHSGASNWPRRLPIHNFTLFAQMASWPGISILRSFRRTRSCHSWDVYH